MAKKNTTSEESGQIHQCKHCDFETLDLSDMEEHLMLTHGNLQLEEPASMTDLTPDPSPSFPNGDLREEGGGEKADGIFEIDLREPLPVQGEFEVKSWMQKPLYVCRLCKFDTFEEKTMLEHLINIHNSESALNKFYTSATSVADVDDGGSMPPNPKE